MKKFIIILFLGLPITKIQAIRLENLSNNTIWFLEVNDKADQPTRSRYSGKLLRPGKSFETSPQATAITIINHE